MWEWVQRIPGVYLRKGPQLSHAIDRHGNKQKKTSHWWWLISPKEWIMPQLEKQAWTALIKVRDYSKGQRQIKESQKQTRRHCHFARKSRKKKKEKQTSMKIRVLHNGIEQCCSVWEPPQSKMPKIMKIEAAPTRKWNAEQNADKCPPHQSFFYECLVAPWPVASQKIRCNLCLREPFEKIKNY